ncbi:hypothetical protein [Streptomyces sp. NPDC089799]|uniref:hypothetical protein n=1 Tax=Streptomyces sp. NPDC089799 TaxID=3155066 RepID=UPI0034249E26
MSTQHLTDRPGPSPSPSPGRPSPTRAALRRARNSRARRLSLPARYLGYVGYFVGAGLISGAVVHHPLDPARYTRIAGYGVLVFLAATVLNEFVISRERPGLRRACAVIGASLMLSFGIGMLSGGLQHFEDFPARGAVLVPLGLVVSFVAFVLKDEHTSWRSLFGPVGPAVVVIAALAFLGLRQLAASTGPAESGGHEHGPAPAPSASAPANAPGGPGAPSSAPTPANGRKSPENSPESSAEKSPEKGHGGDAHSH